MEFNSGEFNYFRICYIVFKLVPEGLRQVFKKEWDFRFKPTHGEWKDSPKNGSDFTNNESPRSRSKNARCLATILNGNTAEWNCGCLLFAILFSDSIGTTLSAAIKEAVDDLRQIRNEIAHISKAKVTDAEFRAYVGRVLLAFNSLSLPISDIEAVKNQTSLPTAEVQNLMAPVGNSKVESFCILTFKPSHQIIRRSNDVTRIMAKMQELDNESNGTVSTIYLSGNPGCGKTQLARQIGEEFFTRESGESEGLRFVATLNAETLETLADSYFSQAKRLGITEYALTKLATAEVNPKERLQQLRCFIFPHFKQFSKWLIIADNVVELSLVYDYLPQTATEELGRGQVLITTQDTSAIPANAPHTYHESLSEGMTPKDAVELLKQVSEMSNNEGAQTVAEALHYQPLSLAAAASYVQFVSCFLTYNWSNFLATLADVEREVTEERLTLVNPAYPKNMTDAIQLAIDTTLKSDEVLRQTFFFFSLCDSGPVPIQAAVSFVKNHISGQTEEMIKTKILNCSLIMPLYIEDEAPRFLRVHSVVHEVLRKMPIMEITEKLTAIPPEITVRGRLALAAYKKALAEGKTCDKRVPVMLIGQDRSGKTSLKKSLRGEPFNPDEESTVGIEVDPSHFKVSNEIWKIGEKDHEKNSETSISYEYHAARATVENLKVEKMVPSPEEGFQETRQSGNIRVLDEVPASPTGFTDAATSVSDDRSETSSDPKSVQAYRHPEQDDSSQQDGSIPKDIETEIVKRLKNDGKVEDEEEVHSVLWDFAGQSVYYTTHPLFLTSRAIYLLVNDLSQNASEKAKPVVKQGMYRKLLDSFGWKTNFDYLDFWMSSIASLANQEDSDQESFESVILPEKLPAVFFVCTHADTLYKRQVDPTTVARELFGSLRTKPYKIHLYDLFVVDNTRSGHGPECPEVVRLRQEVLAISKALPQMKEAIPIKWLKYEKELQAMKEGGKKWIDRDAARTMASEACNILDDQEFQTLLNFLHDKRILIHFDDTPELDKLVVLDPQWLIDVFKMVITVRPYNPKERKFETLWDKLENDGILERKLLERVWAPLLDKTETFESLIAIMEKFSLVCSWPSSDASCGKQYLVPSMLMSHPPEGIMSLVASARIPSLFLKFKSSQVPPGIFPRLVLQFFQWNQEEQGKPQLYHNFARFYTSQKEDCSVILLCHSSSIEVVVHQGTSQALADSLQSKLSFSADVSYETCEVTCARAVRRQLELMLESIRNEFCWLKNMKYEVSYICPVCCQGGAVTFCRIHSSQGCKQEECLHFWFESQLCDVETFICCTKSACAQSNRVDLKQFAPWFAPPRNQLTVDKHNGGTLANAQGSKAIALPCKIQESLLCQSSDSKQVVLHLQETLQPDQASLEEPGPETKQLIRCLARAAKDSNRLDVFEHLREITPAGTTGPLMAEHLDVQNIPVSKRRDLTIDLCGGEEWKLVAEALGLTPQEISFLDNRTLNPLDAALNFIVKQRHITVGELYDLLSECGFPLIADLRL